MRISTKLFLLVVLFSIIFQHSNAQFGQLPPFTVQIEAMGTNNIPGMHSFAFAQSGDKWLFIGGRTNGLHGLNSNGPFDPADINDKVTVVDTATWQVYTANLTQLSQAIADPLRSTNMEYIQDGNYLYMVGGYGFDSIAQQFTSYPTLTAINVDSMINKVMNSLPIAAAIRQVTDTNFAVAGGELGKINSHYYLIFGHDFEGEYVQHPSVLFTQQYSNRVKKFDLTDNGTTISLSSFTFQSDTTNFHRRDLNIAPIVKPDGSFAIGAYGGVFQKNARLPYREPIVVDTSGTTVDTSYHQIMSQYTCAVMPVYDSAKSTMYTTFFGGISLYDYHDSTGVLAYDSLVPFINDITTLTVLANGTKSEALMSSHFYDRLGANAKFISNPHLSAYSNGVLKLNNLPANTQNFAGYMFGGIRANQGNLGVTIANDSIYRIYITTPPANIGVDEVKMNINNAMLYPNPAAENTMLQFYLKTSEATRISLFDITGKEVQLISDEKMNAGNHQFAINISKLSAGVYICKVGLVHLQLIVK